MEVSIAPSLEDFLATECRENLDILLDMVVFPSSKYFDTENIAHVDKAHLPTTAALNSSHFLYSLRI